jgi:hypothetical protein
MTVSRDFKGIRNFEGRYNSVLVSDVELFHRFPQSHMNSILPQVKLFVNGNDTFES